MDSENCFVCMAGSFSFPFGMFPYTYTFCMKALWFPTTWTSPNFRWIDFKLSLGRRWQTALFPRAQRFVKKHTFLIWNVWKIRRWYFWKIGVGPPGQIPPDQHSLIFGDPSHFPVLYGDIKREQERQNRRGTKIRLDVFWVLGSCENPQNCALLAHSSVYICLNLLNTHWTFFPFDIFAQCTSVQQPTSIKHGNGS